MKYKIFVDGQEGTTGLKINERLEKRNDMEILTIDQEKRKDPVERSKLLNEADVVFLCLPDAAARESVSLVQNKTTRIIDASTAHRTSSEWAYGLPELSLTHRSAVEDSKRVAVPGCYATGFNMLLYPLIKEGIISAGYPVSCHAVSGYSGGGKKLIEKYEGSNIDKKSIESPCFYSFALNHKHIPEMHKISGLNQAPLFTPIVSNYYQGMTVAVPIHHELMSKKLSPGEMQEFYAAYYEGQHFIKVIPFDSESYLDNGYLFATNRNGTNMLDIFVFGDTSHILLISRFDNLGKGSSGAAIQNMNIMLGLDENIGL
jgi:N-acetyl-gamma-glutamyl-phosphate reductase